MKALKANDIYQSAKAATATTEENLRRQLAYTYHIFKHYGWCDLIVTHLSARIPGEEALLILPFGLSFGEITPDNIIKVGFDGKILESRDGHTINHNGTTVHRSVYRARPDIHCIFHTHSLHGTAVSSIEDGFIILDQLGMMFYNRVGSHDFDTLFINDNRQQQLLDDLDDNICMVLKNHGLMTVGKTLQETFFYHYYFENACQLQVTTLSMGSAISHPKETVMAATAKKYAHWKDHNPGDVPGDADLLFEAAKRLITNIDF